MLDSTAITPLYVQLMDSIEEDIRSGRYHPGDRLMTENEMAETYDISINTVRRAIGELIDKGLVERKQGKGTFVTKPKFERNMRKLQSFTEIFISRVRFADSEPVVIENNYFTMEYAFLLEANFDDNSLFDYIEKKTGKRVASSEKRIEICRATTREAELLNVKRGEHLLYVKSTAYDAAGQPMYAGRQLINAERFSLYVYESNI